MKDRIVDSDTHYEPSFYNNASHEIIANFYPLVGIICASFNTLEDTLSEYLTEFINPDDYEIGWIVIANMQFSNKIDLWEKILKWYVYDDEIFDEKEKEHLTLKIKNLSVEMKELMIKRNKIVHADWDGMNDELLVKNKTKVSDKGVSHHYLSIKQIEFDKLIKNFNSTDVALHNFNKEIISKLELHDVEG